LLASMLICEPDQRFGIEDLHALPVLGFSGRIFFAHRDDIDLLGFQILNRPGFAGGSNS